MSRGWILIKGQWVKGDWRTLGEDRDLMKDDAASRWLAKNDPKLMKAKAGRQMSNSPNHGKNNLKQNYGDHKY